MEYPLLHIIITTYDPGDNSRFKLLFKTIEALKENIQYSNLAWIIADDGSENFPKDALYTMLEGYPRTFLNAERKGVGRSKNLALRHAFTHSPFVLLLEDDWVLSQPLDLNAHVRVMQENTNVGIIRLGYLGGEMTGQFTGLSGRTYWKLLHKSGFYVYSGQVSLRHQRFYSSVGYHVESATAGKEEEEMCHRYNDIVSVPDILWPAELGCTINAGAFKNIGLVDSVNAVEPLL